MALTKATYFMVDTAPVNVQDYGATGDGSTDDQVAFAAAIAAVRADFPRYVGSNHVHKPCGVEHGRYVHI